MNEKYWKDFYKKFKVKRHSSFAEFCLKYLPKNKPVIDIGCGNGRDSYFFERQGYFVVGIDKAIRPKDYGKASFFNTDFKATNSFNSPVYARFFLHSISNKDVITLISMSNDMLLLEFRDREDKPLMYKHERNSIDGNIILGYLIVMNFDILFYQKSKDLAKFKNENPLICRIIAKRKS